MRKSLVRRARSFWVVCQARPSEAQTAGIREVTASDRNVIALNTTTALYDDGRAAGG